MRFCKNHVQHSGKAPMPGKAPRESSLGAVSATRFLDVRYLSSLVKHYVYSFPEAIRLGNRVAWLGQYALSYVLSVPARLASRPQNRGVRGLERCEARFINLAHRRDRLLSVQRQFEKIGISGAERIDAHHHENGALGCAVSHIEALRRPAAPGKVLMVCEDDLVFEATGPELSAYVEEFFANPVLDVLCLAYNLGEAPTRVSRRLSITRNTQTTACYLVKEKARATVLAVFEESEFELRNGKAAGDAAIDVLWKKLQSGKLFFAIPNRRLGHQAPSFSDVEGRFVDYEV